MTEYEMGSLQIRASISRARTSATAPHYRRAGRGLDLHPSTVDAAAVDAGLTLTDDALTAGSPGRMRARAMVPAKPISTPLCVPRSMTLIHFQPRIEQMPVVL